MRTKGDVTGTEVPGRRPAERNESEYPAFHFASLKSVTSVPMMGPETTDRLARTGMVCLTGINGRCRHRPWHCQAQGNNPHRHFTSTSTDALLSYPRMTPDSMMSL